MCYDSIKVVKGNLSFQSASILKTIGDFLDKKMTATALEDIVAVAIQEIPAQNR